MIEAEDAPGQITTHVNRIALNLFDVLDVRLLAGRGLTAADTLPAAASVIVDQAFADRLAPGGNVIGRRIRFPAEDQSVPNRWMEIVGVVPAFASTFTAAGNLGPPAPTVYMASVPRGRDPVTLIVKVRSDPAHYGQKLQQVTASVDPDMSLEFVTGVADHWQREQKGTRMIAIVVILLNGSVLVLSAAGIHALMAFTVARRRREIGIRLALGADARAVLSGIFGRAMLQVGGGVAAGLAIAGLLEWATAGDNTGGRALILFPSVAAVMFAVGMLAALGPARRGLSVQPTEALRNE
jgi:putative ABC transport system permease protein